MNGDCRPDVQPSCSNEAQVTFRFAAACVCGFQFDFGLWARLILEVMQVFESANCSDGDEQSILLVVSTSFVLCSHNLHLCTLSSAGLLEHNACAYSYRPLPKRETWHWDCMRGTPSIHSILTWYVDYQIDACAENLAHCSLAPCVQRKTLELTGKSRTRGAVQPDVARICNVPHKNFFIVVKVCRS